MSYFQKTVNVDDVPNKVLLLEEGSFYLFRTLLYKRNNNRYQLLIPNTDYTILSLMDRVKPYNDANQNRLAEMSNVCQVIIFSDELTGNVTLVTELIEFEVAGRHLHYRNVVNDIINEATRNGTLNEALSVTRGLGSYMSSSYQPLVNAEYREAVNFDKRNEDERGGLSWGKVQLAVQGITELVSKEVDDLSTEYLNGVMFTLAKHITKLKEDAEREIETSYRSALSTRLSDKQLVHALTDETSIPQSYKIGNVVLQSINPTTNNETDISNLTKTGLGFNGLLRKDNTGLIQSVKLHRIEHTEEKRNKMSKSFKLRLNKEQTTSTAYVLEYERDDLSQPHTLYLYSSTLKKVIRMYSVSGSRGSQLVSKHEINGLLSGVKQSNSVENVVAFILPTGQDVSHENIQDLVKDNLFDAITVIEHPIKSPKPQTSISTHPHASVRLRETGLLDFTVISEVTGYIKVEYFNNAVNTLIQSKQATLFNISEDMIGKPIYKTIRLVNNVGTEEIPDVRISVLNLSNMVIESLFLANSNYNTAQSPNISYRIVASDENGFEGGIVLNRRLLNVDIYTQNPYLLKGRVSIVGGTVVLVPKGDVVEIEKGRYRLTYIVEGPKGVKELPVSVEGRQIGTVVFNIGDDYSGDITLAQTVRKLFRDFIPSDISYRPNNISNGKQVYMLKLQRLNPASFTTYEIYDVQFDSRISGTTFVMYPGQEYASVRLELDGVVSGDKVTRHPLANQEIVIRDRRHSVGDVSGGTIDHRVWDAVIPSNIGNTPDIEFLVWDGMKFKEYLRFGEPFELYLRNNLNKEIGLVEVAPAASDEVWTMDLFKMNTVGASTRADLSTLLTYPPTLAANSTIKVTDTPYVLTSLVNNWTYNKDGDNSDSVLYPRLGVVIDGVVKRMSEYDGITCVNNSFGNVVNLLTGNNKLRVGHQLQSITIGSEINELYQTIRCDDTNIRVNTATGTGNYSRMQIINLVDNAYMSRRSGDKISLFIDNAKTSNPGFNIELEYE